MTTATDATIKQADEARQRAMFEHMIEDFIKRWKPSEPYDQHQFEAQLFSIVRQIYRDAQQPVLDQLTKIAMSVPMPFTVPR